MEWVIGLARVMAVCGCVLAAGCRGVRPGDPLVRQGDEIMVCGQMFHTGVPVVLWTDPGGYDAYRVERRFAPAERASWEASKESLATPNRYGVREPSDPEVAARIASEGWRVEDLAEQVDQFVIHYDASGTSRRCFQILHDVRGLSCHFLLDLDGTVYQTLDLKERAWHATIANNRSIGIEIANIGAYPLTEAGVLDEWYEEGAEGTEVTIPPEFGDGGMRTRGFQPRTARARAVVGEINGVGLVQYDLTREQYESLIGLTAALCRIFPRLECEYPRDESGGVLRRTMTEGEWAGYSGLLGHYHVQRNKVDPGPAFQWDVVVRGARGRLR